MSLEEDLHKMEAKEDLRKARRRLLSIPGFELLEDFIWDKVYRKWTLKFRLCGDYVPTDFVPTKTEWFCTISDNYPYGDITIYPSAENSIIYTFQHQSTNTHKDGRRWRDGKICVSSSLGRWGKKYFNKEPYDFNERLLWHVLRCQDWIASAASDTLSVAGDPFEIPDFPKDNSQLFVFNEDENSFKKWKNLSSNYGTITCKEAFSDANIIPILNFKNREFDLSYDWGKKISDSAGKETQHAWVMLESIPIIVPWQLPTTWNDLFDSAAKGGIDLRTILNKLIFSPSSVTPKNLFIGFPIPKNIGDETSRIYWFAIILPKIPILTGFNGQSSTLHRAQFSIMFKKESVIKWTNSENWNSEEISSRGRCSKDFRSLKFTIVGAGAVGSLLSEMLLRLGCTNIIIIDDDIVRIGNLSRHTLSMNNVLANKAEKLAEKLNLIVPGANINSINKKFDNRLSNERLEKLIEDTDIFVDATANDETIDFISETLAGKNKIFLSLSTGYKAKRLYCFMKHSQAGSIEEEFIQRINPWLKKDAEENHDLDFPREGIGCWHPVFPARIDAIQLLLSSILPSIERFVDNNEMEMFSVVETQFDEGTGYMTGVKIINS